MPCNGFSSAHHKKKTKTSMLWSVDQQRNRHRCISLGIHWIVKPNVFFIPNHRLYSLLLLHLSGKESHIWWMVIAQNECEYLNGECSCAPWLIQMCIGCVHGDCNFHPVSAPKGVFNHIPPISPQLYVILMLLLSRLLLTQKYSPH